MSLTSPAGRPQRLTALVVGLGMAATVAAALGFEHIGGFIPCKLCLQERIPYYVGVPVMGLALVSAWLRLPSVITRGLIAVGGLVMVWSLLLGGYHAGVEWHWWQGPANCSAVVSSSGSGNGILDQIDKVVPPACDEAAGRFLGLSFAGWNFAASAVLAIIAFNGAFASQR